LAETEQRARSTLSRLDSEIIQFEAEMQVDLERTGALDLAEMVSRAESLKARAGGVAAVVAERQRSIERTVAASVDFDVIAGMEAEAAALAERLTATDSEALDLLPQADELQRAERELAEEVATFEARWGSEPSLPTDPAAEARAEAGALRGSLERGQAEMRRLESRRAALTDKGTRVQADRARLRAALDEAALGEQRLGEAQLRAGAELAVATDALHSADDDRRRAESDAHRWTARAEAVAQALHEARARAGAERLAGVDGVIGTLLDLVDVDEGFEAAFEAAAGEVLAAVVLDSPESARRAVEELHGAAAGGAVFSLPPAVAAAPAAQAWLVADRPGLRRRVRGRLPSVDVLLDQLLQHAVIVEGGWREAIDVSIAHPQLVVVTPAGDRFSLGLWRTGGSSSGATGAALEEAHREAASASERAAQAAWAWEQAQKNADSARDALAYAVKAREATVVRQQATGEALARSEDELSESRTELESLRLHLDEVTQRIRRDQARLAELSHILPELEQQAAAEVERVTTERSARDQLADRTAVIAGMRRQLEVRAAGLEERRAITSRRLEEVEDRLQRNRIERAEAASRRRAREMSLTAIEYLLDFVARRTAQLDGILVRLREARRNQSDTTKELSSHLEELRRQRGANERQLSEVRERISRTDLEDAEARLRLENVVEAIRRDLDCEPEAIRGTECPPLPPGTSASSRRAELERELRLMGPINPLALEEHAALQERHQFLEGQLEDVRNARRELTKVIRAVDAEIIEIFGAAYADVAEHFEKLFSTLFPGGEGRLKLSDPDHLLETGIEIEARPSGKNLRRLSLLSGGERSLAALAFLFGVFRARPSPFYMMDEVEAALDDVNLHRFLDLIHEFREEAQLLIVSHQKRTMEAADCLYGVTMAPGGSSRVISERMTAAAG
jgi:chromosome segregation protein